MSKPRRKRRPSAPSRFKVSDRVRVKPGIRDDDHPDIPLGGWAGRISEVGKRGMYGVRWSRETLASIHPICKKRSIIDGTDLEEYWLGEDDLEPDPGGPLAIEQPTHITPRPLSAENQGDRVRMVFGLTSDDFLPAVDGDSLETYYDHLVKELSLPVEARYCPQEEFFNPNASLLRSVVVASLDREVAWDEDEGILCRIRTADGEEVVPLTGLRLHRSDPNYQRVDDFVTWFVGELSEEMDDDEFDDDEDELDDDEDEEDDDEDTEESDEVDEDEDAEEVSSVLQGCKPAKYRPGAPEHHRLCRVLWSGYGGGSHGHAVGKMGGVHRRWRMECRRGGHPDAVFAVEYDSPVAQGQEVLSSRHGADYRRFPRGTVRRHGGGVHWGCVGLHRGDLVQTACAGQELAGPSHFPRRRAFLRSLWRGCPSVLPGSDRGR